MRSSSAPASADGRRRLLILTHFADLGGAELALLASVPRLAEEFDVRAAVPGHGPLIDRLRAMGVVVVDEPLPAARIAHDRLRSVRGALQLAIGMTRYVFRVKRLHQDWRPDLLYVNSLKSGLYGQALAVLWRRPWVWHMRDRLEVGYLGRSGVFGLRTLAALGPRSLFANARGTLMLLPARARRRTTVVFSPVDVASFSALAETRRPCKHEAVRIAMIGRLTPIKGQHLLLEAVALASRTHQLRVRLIGGDLTTAGGQMEELTRLADSLGITEHVEFTGHVADVAAALVDVDIVISYSQWPEPFGQTVIQAMAAGLPVVAAAEGGPAELIDDGVTGVLVPPRDTKALAAAVTALADDPDRRARLATAGVVASKRYSPDEVLPVLVATMRSALRH